MARSFLSRPSSNDVPTWSPKETEIVTVMGLLTRAKITTVALVGSASDDYDTALAEIVNGML